VTSAGKTMRDGLRLAAPASPISEENGSIQGEKIARYRREIYEN
jgi:hypothetical protein